jgi:mannonate dehydratase
MSKLKLSMAAVPATDERLQAMAQIGVKHLVHYDMANTSDKFETFPLLIERAAKFGLNVPVVEAGPPIDKIVLGLEGAGDQIDHWRDTLPKLGDLGVKVICYNFMPQILDDAMVVRTTEEVLTRGGAVTTAFRHADLALEPAPSSDAVTFDAMRENLSHFLEAVLPIAERAGMRLAMHPDDPPISPLGGFYRIMSSPENLAWLTALDSSPANALTLCAGCVGEMDENISAFARRHADRIAFVHLRNIRGTPTDFVETWPDDGDLDLPDFLSTLVDLRVDAYARPDHAPRLATEPSGHTGYGFDGHLFSLGYYRGVLDAIEGSRR